MAVRRKKGRGRALRRRNTAIFAALLLGALLLALAVQRLLAKPGRAALIQVDGEVVARLPLDEDTEVLIGEETGPMNRVTVSGGQVAVTEADCPDQVCVRAGAIDTQGQVIACLPHKLIITVEGEP